MLKTIGLTGRQTMPNAQLATMSPDEFEMLLEHIAQKREPYNIVLQPILLVVPTTGPGGTLWIGEGSVLVTGVFPDQTIEAVGYTLRSLDPAKLEDENRRFIDMLELLLDRTGVRRVPGLTVTIREVRNP
jgi:hypothetical protein